MKCYASVLAGLLLMAAGCPSDGDSGPKENPLEMSQAGRAPVKIGGHAGKAGSHAAQGGAGGAAGSDEPDEPDESEAIAGKGGGSAGKAGSSASGSIGGGGKAGSSASGSIGGGKAGSPASGGSGGGGVAGSAGNAGSSAAGGPAAGSGGSGAPASSVGGSTKLSEIATNAQAQVVCDKLRAQLAQADLDVIERGSCALQGLSGALQGLGECSQLAAECLAEPSEVDSDCTTADLPSCDASVDEFLACAKANMQVSVAFFGKLTCQSDLDQLTEPATPPACVSLYAKCPELEDGSDDAS